MGADANYRQCPRFIASTTTQPSSIEEEGFLDGFGARIDIFVNLRVREAHHTIALPFEPPLALDVAQLDVGKSLMNAPVNLNNQPPSMAGKVCKIATDGRLPTEIDVHLAKFAPKLLFRPRHEALQAARA